jgi:VanZ family protein
MSDVTGLDRHSVKNWLPVFLWAALIFLFSSETFSNDNTAVVIAPWVHWAFPLWSTDTVELVHLLLRKLGHLGEYFVFALLLARALRAHVNGVLGMRQLFLVVGLTALYATSDELHQAFVPGRSASAGDVLIDICGGLAGALYFHFGSPRKKIT